MFLWGFRRDDFPHYDKLKFEEENYNALYNETHKPLPFAVRH